MLGIVAVLEDVAKLDSLVWVPDNSPFTLDNIPFGVYSTKDDPTPRCATAVGDYAMDLRALGKKRLFSDESVTDALSQVRKAPAQVPYRNICQASMTEEESGS